MSLENIELAVSELKANKIRTVLTMLGIIIGIASVIAIMTVGDSMNRSIMSSMSEMGANNISFYVVTKSMSEDDMSIREMKDKDYFSEEMFQYLQKNFGNELEGIALQKSLGSIEVSESGKKATVNLTGYNSHALSGKNLKILAGRTLNKQDTEETKKVILVSNKYAEKFYGSDYNKALGKTVEGILNEKYYSYTIVGVYEYTESAMDFSNQSSGQLVTDGYLPLATVTAQTGSTALYDSFEAIAKEDADATALADSIAKSLNETYYIDNDAYEAYGYSMKQMIQETESMVKTLQLALSAIAAISLLVGGIGVMNIMVVSITERTREIGTRKALGASNTSIRLQFITEAVVICLIGGAIGIVVGMSLGLLASKLMGYPGVPSLSGVVVSVLVSMAFGIFFGYYPANKAAKMNPIDALRYE